jgi:sugar phosphate isomerase/epimerase
VSIQRNEIAIYKPNNRYMNSRRKFLQQAAALTAGGALLGQSSWANSFYAKTKLPAPGIQLFTLMNEMDKDTEGTLLKVASAGYKNIESAFSKQGGFYGKKPKEFKALLKDMGMDWRSHHVMGRAFKMPPNFKMPANMKIPTGPDGKPFSMPVMKNLEDNSQEMVDQVAEAGIPYLVCANINISTGEEIKKSAEVLQRAGEQAKKAGVQLAYHNHATEFDATDGIISYDYFTSQISADIMKMELDLGWVFKAGKNPVDIFKKNPGRFPLLHVKDMTAAGEIVPFGEGVYDFKEAFRNIDIAGVEYFFLEQDFPKNPFENIVTSVTNFNKFNNTL